MSHKATETQAKAPDEEVEGYPFPQSITLHTLIVILPLVMKEENCSLFYRRHLGTGGVTCSFRMGTIPLMFRWNLS